ncbi:hypothetical protein [Burkholderia pseudomallei]|uniref:hypothetical protein n=1 Tax=Burkholderia pseudomallei TaxID=28450 RepID=UPI001F4561EB|nr:hypothetical protein [Burkholderia pseudomallei]
MYWRKSLAAALLAPVLTACGGGDDPPAPVVRLCPKTIDYNTVFTAVPARASWFACSSTRRR